MSEPMRTTVPPPEGWPRQMQYRQVDPPEFPHRDSYVQAPCAHPLIASGRVRSPTGIDGSSCPTGQSECPLRHHAPMRPSLATPTPCDSTAASIPSSAPAQMASRPRAGMSDGRCDQVLVARIAPRCAAPHCSTELRLEGPCRLAPSRLRSVAPPCSGSNSRCERRSGEDQRLRRNGYGSRGQSRELMLPVFSCSTRGRVRVGEHHEVGLFDVPGGPATRLQINGGVAQGLQPSLRDPTLWMEHIQAQSSLIEEAMIRAALAYRGHTMNRGGPPMRCLHRNWTERGKATE